MGSVADKLNKLISTKEDIKEAITSKGVEVGDEFDTYGDAIRSISGGGGGLLDYSVVFKSEAGNNLSIFSSKNDYPIIVNPPYISGVYWTSNGTPQSFPYTANGNMTFMENIVREYYGDGSLNIVSNGYSGKIVVNGQLAVTPSVNYCAGNIKDNGNGLNEAFKTGYQNEHGVAVPYPRATMFNPMFQTTGSNRNQVKISSDGKVKQINELPVSSNYHNATNWSADATTVGKTVVVDMYCKSTAYNCTFGSFKMKINGTSGTLGEHVNAGRINPLVLIFSPSTDTYYFTDVLNIYNGGTISKSYPECIIIFSLPIGSVMTEVNFALTASYYGAYSDSITCSIFDKDVLSITMLRD